MTKRASVVTVICVLLAAAWGFSQEGPPKPGPEHKRMGFFEGTWKFEGEAKESEMGPAGKMSSTETCEWFQGGFALVCRSEGKGPMGAHKGLGIMTYDAMGTKAYAYFGIDNYGGPYRGKGELKDGTWTWNDESMMGDKSMKIRVTVKETSPTSYDFKFEMSVDGGAWMTTMEGSATKSTS